METGNIFRLLHSSENTRHAPPTAARADCPAVCHLARDARLPNVVIVITDDQGYGDIAAHGNTMIRTPHLDRLHAESVRLTDYHVDPTCSPTRSALMTGRYSTRTGVWHTIMGRSLMNSRELTLGEVFAAAGYHTGMYGKWHLGDNYPGRPQDQGFTETIHHGGGGITQTPDWWGNDYFDDTFVHADGTAEQFTGYCTDVWFDQALKFIDRHKDDDQPFFCYLSTNAPHGPYLVDESYSQPYMDAGVPSTMANFYGMITNIDENVGRLVTHLDDCGIAEDTILIFTTDNGTAAGVTRTTDTRRRRPTNERRQPAGQADAWPGFNAGMRGQKGSEYDGGHRVPFFIRWPGGGLTGGRDADQLTAHIDVLPTLVELCGIEKPDGPPIDGTSLVAALRGDTKALRDRTLFVHSQRLEHVVKWKSCSVMTERWRFVDGKQLFDMAQDPGQTSDIASAHPEVVEQLTRAYEHWWESLSPVFDDVVRITLGSDHEAPVRLTCHDWHTNDGPVPWSQGAVRQDPAENGFWAVQVETPGRYQFRLRMRPAGVSYPLPDGTARVLVGAAEAETTIPADSNFAELTLDLPAGPAQMQTWLMEADGTQRGAYFVDVSRLP